MDRSYFKRSKDTLPLLPQHRASLALEDLPPRPYSPNSPARGASRTSSHSSQASASQSPVSRRFQPRQYGHIPPPIATSTLLPVHPPSSNSTPSAPYHLTSSLTLLSRRERALQSSLQTLLDAQSAGLTQGRSLQNADDRSSDAGSSTPTSRSVQHSNYESREDSRGRVIPVRQPRLKKLSLRTARRGIGDAISELLELKISASSMLDSESTAFKSTLMQVQRWQALLAGFDTKMKAIEDGPEGREALELNTEKMAVETDIRELEDRLLTLRARERWLGERIGELENRREAKGSSFVNGRQELEGRIKEFLRRPSVGDSSVAIYDGGYGAGETAAFMTLPPKRRTLEMASDWLATSVAALERQQKETEMEIEALQQGGKMWEQTVEVVTGFEEDLKAQMKEGGGHLDLRGQLVNMGSVVKELESKALKAGTEGWNLLICAVGAELEAFREGEEILRGALDNVSGVERVGKEERQDDVNGKEGGVDGHGLNELGVPQEGAANGRVQESLAEEKSESEDDGPDPSFLFSKDDGDDG